MTAEPVTVADDRPVSVAAVRSFIGRRRRRSWLDWYVAGFALLIAGIYLSDILASPLGRLSKSASHAAATHAAAPQAVTGAGLVIGVGMGLLLLAQALGPLALSPADASWLLLTPLSRRAILRRPALTARWSPRRPARCSACSPWRWRALTSGLPGAGCPGPGCSSPPSQAPAAAWPLSRPRRSPSRGSGHVPWSAPPAPRSPSSRWRARWPGNAGPP